MLFDTDKNDYVYIIWLAGWFYPIISRIFFRHSCSIRMNTGAIWNFSFFSFTDCVFVLCFGVFVFVFVSVLCTSYVNMLVLAVAVSHSPAREVTSSPQESWLKNRGWPGNGHDGQDHGHDGHDDHHDGRDNDHDDNFDSNDNVKKVGERKDNIESMGLNIFAV